MCQAPNTTGKMSRTSRLLAQRGGWLVLTSVFDITGSTETFRSTPNARVNTTFYKLERMINMCGNDIHSCSMTLVCEEVCGDGTGIVDMKCCWCQRTVHNKCQQQLSDLCDLGEFKRFLNFSSPKFITNL